MSHPEDGRSENAAVGIDQLGDVAGIRGEDAGAARRRQRDHRGLERVTAATLS
jgi:hypothetical protein